MPLEPIEIAGIIGGILGLVLSVILGVKELYYGTYLKPKIVIGNIREEEEGFHTGAVRKYQKIVIHNNGKKIANNCEATVTLAKENSTAKVLPSPYEKLVVWEDGITSRKISVGGKAILYFVFSQNSFCTVQYEAPGKPLPQDQALAAKIATPKSFADIQIPHIRFNEDGLRMGDTYLSLHIQTEDGHYADAVYCVTIGSGWRDIAMRRVC